MLPAFTLARLDGKAHSFPSGRTALICFVNDDCPTCNDVLPVVEKLHATAGATTDVLVVGQSSAGNRALSERHQMQAPLLDDSELAISYAYGIDTVPTIVLAGGDGEQLVRLEGFDRDAWRQLVARVPAPAGAADGIDWEALPRWRPGCGSLSADPLHAARLAAMAAGSPIRARRIEVGARDDVHELLFDQGYTDGLPVVPPTPERVLHMLGGTRRDAGEVVAVVPPNLAPATVEKIAINAVMAGCRPEYLPVVIAAVEAVCNDEFNIHGVMSTTMGASPVLIVNGPIRQRLGMNMQLGALGHGNRANATIGRALRLLLRNVGGARPGGTERSTLGNPMKFTMCLAEWEERSPWQPLHVERGYAPDESVVTACAMSSGPTLIVDHSSRTAAALGRTIGEALEATHNVRGRGNTDVIVVISPEHADTLARGGYTKDALRQRIQQVTARRRGDLAAADDLPGAAAAGRAVTAGPLPPADADAGRDADELVPKFAAASNINIVVAGGEAGKFSAAFHGWGTGPRGSIITSRRIDARQPQEANK